MPDEAKRKELVAEYFRRLNAGDVDQILELFAEDARIEDPLGYEPRQGRRSLEEYFRFNVVEAKIQDTIEKIVGAQDDRSVAVALKADSINFMDPEKRRIQISAVLTFGVNTEGLIDEMRCFWGFTDLLSGDGS